MISAVNLSVEILQSKKTIAVGVARHNHAPPLLMRIPFFRAISGPVFAAFRSKTRFGSILSLLNSGESNKLGKGERVHRRTPTQPLANQALLPQQPLCLTHQLSVRLARQNTFFNNSLPVSNAVLHQCVAQNLCFFPRPPWSNHKQPYNAGFLDQTERDKPQRLPLTRC